MKNRTIYIPLVSFALLIGICMSIFVYFAILSSVILGIFLLLLIIFAVIDFIQKTPNRKKWVPLIAICLLAFTTFIISDQIIQKYWQFKTRNIISKIYEYKKVNNLFPKSSISIGITEPNYRYHPDSSLEYFELIYNDRFGFPHKFNSKDSSWHL